MGSQETNYQHKYHEHTFRGKRKDEEIIVMLRRHWIILLIECIPLIIFLAVLIAESFFVPFLAQTFPIEINPKFFSLISSFLFLFYWLILFVVWLDYYLDVWIVTDQRIINIEQFSLFRREISELDHGKIQDVTTEVHGIIPTILKFGSVHIQTAGSKTRFEFKQVPDPMLVRTMIMKLQKKSFRESKIKEGELLRGRIS
ncbi:MAG: PH domain-containing protein [Patescibacteria group bacterium]|nr:PH domain-containing protein [Patescibacteria group bacterium]